MRTLSRLMMACCMAAMFGACTAGSDAAAEAQIQRIVLTELFLVRERARELVLWADSSSTGPVLSALQLPPARAIATPDSLPVSEITLAQLESMFRDAPDGWREFYQRYPRSPGLVEVARMQYTPNDDRASVVIGRSCGEHCRMAWRVVVAKGESGWTVERVDVLQSSRPGDRS